MKEMKSCNPSNPFVKFDAKGVPAELNYNLPQSTCYEAVGPVMFTIDKSKFQESETKAPGTTIWNDLKKIPGYPDSLSTQLMDDPKLVLNHHLLTDFLEQDSETIGGSEQADIEHLITKNTEEIKERLKVKLRLEMIRKKVTEGYIPVIKKRFSGKLACDFIKIPDKPNPRIYLLLHYKIASYAGDFGLGSVVKTFSLLPGERTKITVRHFERTEVTRKNSENVLDSFSESSAEDLENTLEERSKVSFSGSIETEITAQVGGSMMIPEVMGSANASVSNRTNISASVETQNDVLNKSIAHHVNKSDSQRKIEVNAESLETSVVENEETITRELENINKSRVLNFIFRQLTQEFHTITYLDDVTIVYENGFPERNRSAKLSGMDELLSQVLKDAAAVKSVKDDILASLANILDYQGTAHCFVEQVTRDIGNPFDTGAVKEQVTYFQKLRNLRQTSNNIEVPGIITRIQQHIIRTPSLLVEALLGEGEALDCYNGQLQDAAVNFAHLQNEKTKQSLAIIEGIKDPIEKAKLYKEVFGDMAKTEQDVQPAS